MRPTKYNEEILKKTNDYLMKSITETDTHPTIIELSLILGVDDDTIVEWCKIYKEFSASIKAIKKLQEQRLQFNGLNGKFNNTMSIFLLKCNHGYIETSRQEITGRDGEPLSGFNIKINKEK